METKNDEEVLNVRQATFHYLAKHPWYYISAIFILILSITLSYYAKSPNFLFFAIGIIFVMYMSFSGKIRKHMMQQFAQSLNYTFLDSADMTSVEGNLFSYNFGSNKQIINVISGVNDEHNVRIFTFTYVVRSGKSSHTEYYTVFENTFHSEIPHIILNRSIPFLTSTDLPFSDTKHVSLEGEFDKYFSLNVEKEFEIEALEIFTPDFMNDLLATKKDFSMEFYKNRLYIYKQKLIDSREELDSLFDVADKVCMKIEPAVNGMKDDVEAMQNEAKEIK